MEDETPVDRERREKAREEGRERREESRTHRSIIIFQRASDLKRSVSICSIISFVCPYGFVGPCDASSRTGTDLGKPYTVADEENIKFRQSKRCIICSKLIVPVILL